MRLAPHQVDCPLTVVHLLHSVVFSYIAFVARDKVQILQGEPRGYKQPLDAAASGKQVIRYFCSDCGTPLWAAAESVPHAYTIKLALFGNNMPPGKEIYWKYAQRESTLRTYGSARKLNGVLFSLGEALGVTGERV